MPPKNPSGQVSIDSGSESILVIVGRLLAATEAAADGIKTLSEESKTASVGVQASQQAIQALQRTLSDLDRIVRTGNGDSLVTQLKLLCDEQTRIRDDLDGMQSVVESCAKRLDQYDHYMAGEAGGYRVWWYVLCVLAWLITTGVAIYGAISGR